MSNLSLKVENIPKVGIFNYDESEINQKNTQHKIRILDNLANFVKAQLSAKEYDIVVICSQNSIIKTKDHIQHKISEKLKNTSYELLSKIHITKSEGFFSLFKNSFNVRTRIWYNKNTISFKPDKKFEVNMNKNSNSINITTNGNKTKMEISSVGREKIYPSNTNKNIRDKKIEQGIGATLTKIVINNNEYIIYNSNPPAFIYQKDFLNNISLSKVMNLRGKIEDDRKVNLIYISSNRFNYKYIDKHITSKETYNTNINKLRKIQNIRKFYEDYLYLDHNINYFNLNSIVIVSSNTHKNMVIGETLKKIKIALDLYASININKEENIEKFNELWVKFMYTINDIVSYEYLIDNEILSDFYKKFNILQNKIRELLNTRISKALISLETKIKNKNINININKLEQEFKDCNNIISKYQYLISESMLDNFKEGYKLLQYKIKNFKLENNKRKQNTELKQNVSLIKSNNLNKIKKLQINFRVTQKKPLMPYQQRGIITH
jgi:hypothetical protein